VAELELRRSGEGGTRACTFEDTEMELLVIVCVVALDQGENREYTIEYAR
jgi:hypothetical protein